MKKLKSFDVFILVISILFVGYVFLLPDKVPLHWNIHWEIDRYGSRYELLIISLIPLLIYWLMEVFKRIDPQHQKVENKDSVYQLIRKGITLFMVMLVIFFYYQINHPKVNGTIMISFIIGFMFIMLGNYMPIIPQNYFLGVKTPWTISNEKVWKKTHRICGFLFVLGGIVIVCSGFISDMIAFMMILLVSLAISLFSCLYSYLLYRKGNML